MKMGLAVGISGRMDSFLTHFGWLGGPKLGQEEPLWIEKVFLYLPLPLEPLLELVGWLPGDRFGWLGGSKLGHKEPLWIEKVFLYPPLPLCQYLYQCP